MKTAVQLRKEFIDYFKNLGHTFIPSSSLLPINDPSLLFINAGMNQFKDIFLGYKKPEVRRAVNYQKCLRAGGKHNDLEEVGIDTYHHTFFEMLGNWSFGDYYKKEAIIWAWELVTKVWKIPKKRLYATIYETDDESFELWKKYTDVGEDRIYRFGKKYNFWEMGETGPCGPCTEIHMDLTPDITATPAMINGDSNDLIELWNLVFIQFNNKGNGIIDNLPEFHVDTGMGLERLLSVLNGYGSNYKSELFQDLIKAFGKDLDIKYGDSPKTDSSYHVLADHLRALVFSISDGILPSNDGRGYVLRRILRRAVRHTGKLGVNEPFLYKHVGALIKIMDKAYPEIKERHEFIEHTIYSEEENFLKTLENGMKLLNQRMIELKEKKQSELSGNDVFYLYDTFGFPADLTGLICKEQEITIDSDGFNEIMNKRREESRQKRDSDGFSFEDALKGYPVTEFSGYDTLLSDGEVLGILNSSGQPVEILCSGDSGYVITDSTPFYGEKGGQVGDIGSILRPDMIFDVTKTMSYNDIIVHEGKITSGELRKGDRVRLSVDKSTRSSIQRNHTATHLLHSALRKVLGNHVKQSGSLVEPERLRFDFNHFEGLKPAEIEEIELNVQRDILENYPVVIKTMEFNDAKESGAMALFSEKYSSVVRTIKVGDVSFELCGGTHCDMTGDIGLFKITGEYSVSAGIRRIEAVTGIEAFNQFQKLFRFRKTLEDILKTSGRDPIEEIVKIQNEIKLLHDQVRKFNQKKSSNLA
ncbi:MAG: alanine--tRNA ligase, partial [bacterium]|nr:alanine--tRNA ligase [bacterium]